MSNWFWTRCATFSGGTGVTEASNIEEMITVLGYATSLRYEELRLLRARNERLKLQFSLPPEYNGPGSKLKEDALPLTLSNDEK
jgi:hypothetical protein